MHIHTLSIATLKVQHAARATPTAGCVAVTKHRTCANATRIAHHPACNAQRANMLRASAQHPSAGMDPPTGREDRSHTTCNIQPWNTQMQQVRTPCNIKHTCIVRSTHVATCTTYHATYIAPHAARCNTHNCQQRGPRTALERAMLPPLNATDPSDMLATPPSCTPPPQSASDPIGIAMPRVRFRLRCRRSSQTRTSR